ncbi:hypothetical protein ABZS77_22140 [Micromonospora sp. NPDC005298]|uniref:hypothetical protein n=1 Tax=Micromonospora sp. NPDC005298 TaxID=3156873 RepID=UPI0033A0E042
MGLGPMARIRVKFYSFAAVTVAGIAVGAPMWSVLAAALICVAIPFAVVAQDAGPLRALFLPSRVAAPATTVRKAAHHAQIP